MVRTCKVAENFPHNMQNLCKISQLTIFVIKTTSFYFFHDSPWHLFSRKRQKWKARYSSTQEISHLLSSFLLWIDLAKKIHVYHWQLIWRSKYNSRFYYVNWKQVSILSNLKYLLPHCLFGSWYKGFIITARKWMNFVKV